MAYVNTLGLTSKFPIVTSFVTLEIQRTVHTQPVHVDMTHFRTKFHTLISSCPVVTVLRPKATENVYVTNHAVMFLPMKILP